MRIVHGLLLAALCTAPASAQNADTVLLNGKIVTLEAAGIAEALAVTDGRIVGDRNVRRDHANSPVPRRAGSISAGAP